MRLTHSDNQDAFINMKPLLCLINIHIIFFFLPFLALCASLIDMWQVLPFHCSLHETEKPLK